MEAASRAPLEPLSEAGPEMPSAPSSGPRSPAGARPEALQPLNDGPDDLPPLLADEMSLALLDPDTVPMVPPAAARSTAAPAPPPALTEDLPEDLSDSLSLMPPPSPPAPPKSDAAPVQSPASAGTPAAAAAAGKAPARSKLSLPAQPPAQAPAKGRVEVSAAPASGSSPAASAGAAAAPAARVEVPSPAMDRDFIARNQIVERYISGRLPLRGATDFEKFCTEHPELLDELGLPERVNAGLRLLEAAGKPEPWQEPPRRFWEKPHLAIGLGVATLALAIGLAVVWSGSSQKSARISKLEKLVAEQPLEPATQTRTIRLLPSYKGSTETPAVVVGGSSTQLADLKLDLSRSAYRNFRVTIDRADQGRVAILHNLAKDSNGHLRIALNTSALGPGNYQFTIEGVNWKGETIPDAWLTIGIAPR